MDISVIFLVQAQKYSLVLQHPSLEIEKTNNTSKIKNTKTKTEKQKMPRV